MAMYENANGLDLEIERLTKKLGTLDPTSEEYKAVRISLNDLYKLRNEQYKVEIETDEKRDKTEAELKQKADELEVRKQELALAEKQRVDAVTRSEAELKQKADELEVRKQELALAEVKQKDELASQKSQQIHDYIVTGANMVVGVLKLAAVIGFSLIVSDQGYKFEETGVATSQTFREAKKNALDMVKDVFKK